MTIKSKSIKLGLLSLLVAFVSVFTACEKSEVITNNYNIEYVNVTLDATELVAIVEKPMTKASTRSTTAEYQHKFPESYTAYFVSKETKGEFKEGDIVDSLTVNSGSNTIRIPKLKYKVYVTNYKHKADKWYTWGDAVEQLPRSSDALYLIGNNEIDYSTVTTGEVELTNPYAAVMIKKNKWTNGTPTHYDNGNKPYELVKGDWYLLYIRSNKTNTKVPISIAGNPNETYTLDKPIQGNNIYQYTIDGSVLNGGNLGIIVKPFEKDIIKETINL